MFEFICFTEIHKNISREIEYQQFDYGETILNQGDIADSFYYILFGNLKMIKNKTSTMQNIKTDKIHKIIVIIIFYFLFGTMT